MPFPGIFFWVKLAKKRSFTQLVRKQLVVIVFSAYRKKYIYGAKHTQKQDKEREKDLTASNPWFPSSLRQALLLPFPDR